MMKIESWCVCLLLMVDVCIEIEEPISILVDVPL
jgi:hypothetical protein